MLLCEFAIIFTVYFDSLVRNMASSRDGKSVKQWVDDCIGSKAVVVFSKSYCPFCDMAKVCFNIKTNMELLIVICLNNYHYKRIKYIKMCTENISYICRMLSSKLESRIIF